MSSTNLLNLDKRTVLITGAAGLLGKQHAIALLEQGATVVLTDISQAALDDLQQSLLVYGAERSACYVMDVTQKASIQAVYQQLKEQHTEIDILINNAAIDPKVKQKGAAFATSRFENFDVDDWNLQVNVGLTGAFLCSQVFGTAMAQRQRGVILNIASDLSVIAPDQRIYRQDNLTDEQQPVKPVTYSVIKTGLIGLTRYLAAYWADQRVRVNALSPGGIFAGQDDIFVNKLTSLIPMGRMANLDEYHGAVQFLCSDASQYLTGQNIIVDGGRSIL